MMQSFRLFVRPGANYLRSITGVGSRGIAGYAAENKAVLILAAIALATRLPLLSISLDEGDSANFYNALSPNPPKDGLGDSP